MRGRGLLRKVPLVGVETRESEGLSRGGLKKVRLATTVSLKATSRKIIRSGGRNI